jgi:CRP-like cAMP-binding protein
MFPEPSRSSANRRHSSNNRLLDALPQTSIERIAPALKRISRHREQSFAWSGHGDVFFPHEGAVSLVRGMESGDVAEVAMVGNEGIVGSTALFDQDQTPSPITYIIHPCGVTGDLLSAIAFSDQMHSDERFATLVARYRSAFVTQIMQNVACSAAHSIEQRCGRWLLSARDRVKSDHFPLTQDFLAELLGVRRPTITLVFGALQEAGHIRSARGRITIVDARALEHASCECYQAVKLRFDRLFPAASYDRN